LQTGRERSKHHPDDRGNFSVRFYFGWRIFILYVVGQWLIFLIFKEG
jgi:hypothetical protein